MLACDEGAEGVVDVDGLVQCSSTTPGIRIDPETARTFVYPGKHAPIETNAVCNKVVVGVVGVDGVMLVNVVALWADITPKAERRAVLMLLAQRNCILRFICRAGRFDIGFDLNEYFVRAHVAASN